MLDDPGGGADRKWRSDNQAREKLAEQGIEMDNASLQTTIWYPEKDVFEHLGGVGEKSATTPDYAAALSKAAQKEGPDEAAIQSAISAATAGSRKAEPDQETEDQAPYQPWAEDPDPVEVMTPEQIDRAVANTKARMGGDRCQIRCR